MSLIDSNARRPGDGPKIAIVHPSERAATRWAQEMRLRLPGASVSVWPDAPEDVEYAVGWGPPEGFFERLRALKAFFSLGAGVDHLHRNRGLPPSLPLVRLEDAGMGFQMAEYCCHEVIRHYRSLDAYGEQQRAGQWQELRLTARADFGVGVLGLGVLGSRVARAVASFGYPVSGYTRSPRTLDGVTCFAGPTQLPEFLARSKVLILMAPLTDDTRDLIDAERLARLPRGAWLVNVARGELVVDDALIAAIDAGHLAGATLDVFREEPLPPDHPFWRHPRIRMTPHIAAITLLRESADQIANKLARLHAGERVGGLVDRALGY
ncbi:MAG: hypothetical protein RIS35_381 [Pseudomonadota bacterium]|jgi:glyoxylate/hydroxypyruvate reductase A